MSISSMIGTSSKVYRVLEPLGNFFILNLLWLLACLPIITVFPASVAMFGVVREWVKGRQRSTFEAFISFFKSNFKKSLQVGVIWVAVGGFLLVNSGLIDQAPSALHGFLYAFFLFSAVLYLLTSMYLMPVLVNYDVSASLVLKTSLWLSVSQPLTTFLCLVVVGTAATAFVLFSGALVLGGSVTAYCVYRLCDRAFQRVEG